MIGKLAGWGDTIVALATPPGVGAIGVIRVSGASAFPIVNRLFAGKDLATQASHTLHLGLLKDGDEQLDEVVVSLFRAPRSYTGEDVIEISCHGSPIVQQNIIAALQRQGARLAKAGEFTQRAFLNGKLDLAQAEAVADLIASQSDAAARTALHAVRGGFSQTLKDLRERLVSFSALIELELDFSQEDVEFADRTQLYHLIEEATETTTALLQSFRLGNVIKNGVSVAIVGKPNAGKSTLLNALLNEDRAIVSEIAGTTRDTIEEVLNIDGILFRLIDTAGIRHHTSDVIEQIGVGRSLEKMEQADIVVYLFDVREEARVNAAVGLLGEDAERLVGGRNDLGVGPGNLVEGKEDLARVREDLVEGRKDLAGGREDLVEGRKDLARVREDLAGGREDLARVREDLVKRGKAFLLVGNKVDLASPDGVVTQFPEEVWISARLGKGVDVLRQRLVDLVLQGETAGEGTIVTNARHFQALEKVGEALESIKKGLDDLLPGDLLALDIRVALHYLGEITGEITTEERLGYIFGKFCIGK